MALPFVDNYTPPPKIGDFDEPRLHATSASSVVMRKAFTSPDEQKLGPPQLIVEERADQAGS